MTNLLLIAFHEEGNLFFYWRKNKYTTCTFILKVFALLFDQSVKSRNSFCFEALTLGHDSSALGYGEMRPDGDFFSAFVFGPQLQYPSPLGGRIREELSQQRVACPEGGLR